MNVKVTSASGRMLVALGLILLGYIIYRILPQNPLFWSSVSPKIWGLLSLLGLWVLLLVFTSRINPFSIIIGADGRPSTSKLKPFLWTVVVIYSYVAIYADRYSFGVSEAISSFPASLLLAMGFSAVTAVTAKGITETKLASGQINKPPVETAAVTTASSAANNEPVPPTSANAGPAAIFEDDKGFPDLAKIQTMAWTLIAIVTYLFYVSARLGSIKDYNSAAAAGMPDIDQVLLVLMGLGDALYLGNKLVTTDTPVISAIAPSQGKAEDEITVLGTKFGTSQVGGQVTIDREPVLSSIVSWADREIKFKLPSKHPNQTSWSPPQQIRIGVIAGGLSSANEQVFTVISK